MVPMTWVVDMIDGSKTQDCGVKRLAVKVGILITLLILLSGVVGAKDFLVNFYGKNRAYPYYKAYHVDYK